MSDAFDSCKNEICAYPTCIRRPPPLGGGIRRNIAMTLGMEKLEWFGYTVVKKNVDDIMITRFDRMHERDRQTDRHRMTA